MKSIEFDFTDSEKELQRIMRSVAQSGCAHETVSGSRKIGEAK